MESLKIIGLCIVSAVAYGIVHDLVTANLCVEYFSVFHPDIFHTNSPWLLALGWGVVATWWMGLFLGPFIAVAARSGALPPYGWRDLVRPLGVVLLASYGCSLTFGLIGYFMVKEIPSFVLKHSPRVAEAHLSPDRQRVFTADLYGHNASYLASGIGAFSLCGWLIWKRMRAFRETRLSGTELKP